MNFKFESLDAHADQEAAVELFRKYNRPTLPVVDSRGILLGIVTVDDILDVQEEEVTEDIQKLGGSEALEEAYSKTAISTLVRKRASWLVILFVGEMFTASAMSRYQAAIEQAVVLALFVPLIISSGGNSGSQASTLIIRALAVGELKLRDWSVVLRRELIAGSSLGALLGLIGFIRIMAGYLFGRGFGDDSFALACTVFLSLTGVVTLGSIAGAMLPFLLKSVRLDPATSSAPFVATIVDVVGLMIYFSLAVAIFAW
jgi:magnesium transporter